MGLLNQSYSINEINEIISKELMKPTTRIIGDISLSDDDFEILVSRLRLALKADFQKNSKQYSESLMMCLVYCAQIYFSNNDYWSHVENHFMPISLDFRQKIRKQFNAICTLYGLPKFEHERQLGHAIITPIICHAGIPRAQLDEFFRLFEEAVQDAEQSGWSDLSDGIFDYFEMRAPVYIRRFINSLENDRSTFIMQWQDVTQRIYHDLSTADELTNELKASYENEGDVLISYRFLSQYCEWRNRPVEIASGQKKNRIAFNSPRILLNLDGMGIYIRLPQQRLLDEFPAAVVNWLIRSDNFQTNTSCPVYYNQLEGQSFSEEASVVLRPARRYIVELFSVDDSKPLATWNIDFMGRSYLAFNASGELIKSDSLTGNYAILILPEHYLLKSNSHLSELSRIPYWPKYQAYSISYQPSDIIAIHDRSSGDKLDLIQISNTYKPELVQGELLFNNPGIYTTLPIIRLPNQNGLSWKATLIRASERMPVSIQDTWSNVLHLCEWIAASDYGLFEVRLQNSNGTRFQIRFYYVPNLSLTTDSGRWPQPITGYHSNNFQCVMPDYMEISLDHYEIETNIVHGQERRMLFTSLGSFTSTNGRIRLNLQKNPLIISFKIAIRSLLWSIIGLSNNGQLQMTGSTIRQDWKSLVSESDLYLLISTGDLGAASLNSRITAHKPNGDKILDRPIQLRSWKQIKFNLTDVLLSPEQIDSHRLTIALTVISPDQSIEGHFPLLIVSDRLKVENLILSKDDWSVCFEWQERGEKTDRVLVCQNIGEPWQEDLIFPVMDAETTLRLPHNAFPKSTYACSIEPTPDASPFGAFEYMPANFIGKRVCTLGIENSESIPLSLFNRKMISYLLSNDSDDSTIAIPILDQAEDVIRLAKSYLFMKQMANLINFSKKPELKEKYAKANTKYQQIARSCKFSPDTVILSLLRDCFSAKQLNSLFFFYELNWLQDTQIGRNWQPRDFYAVADACPELAFQVSLSTGAYLEWIIRWIGEHDLVPFMEISLEEPPLPFLQERIAEKLPATGRWGSHYDYWGSTTDNFEFTRYVADLKPSESRLDESELLQRFDLKFNSKKRRLFDKNYLLLLQGLKVSMNSHAANVSKIIDFVQKLDRGHVKIFRDRFPKLMSRLENRTDYSENPLNELAYSIGMIIFIGVLYRHGMWLQHDKTLVRQLARINRIFPDFYRHDLVLIELYLIDGGL